MRTIHSDTYGFSIDTTSVQLIETSSYRSYTFVVERDFYNPDVLENYVLTQYNDSIITQMLVAYPVITNEEGEDTYDIPNGILNVITDEGLIYTRETSCASLMEYEEPVCVYTRCSEGNHSMDEPNWQQCHYWNNSSLGNPPSMSCSAGGWVDTGCPDSNGTSGPSGPSGTTGGSNNTGDPSDLVLVPLPMQTIISIINCINNNTLGQTDSTTIDPELLFNVSFDFGAIYNYLIKQNACSEQVQEFVILAIENLIEIEDIIFVTENLQDYRFRMSDDELDLFDTLTTNQQILYLSSAKQAEDKTNELWSTPCERYNGKGDAFRHAYWNALSSERIGVGLTNLLTTRHENRPPSYVYAHKESEMDLFNNQVGRNIVFNGFTNLLFMEQEVLNAFNNGELRYLTNLNQNLGQNCRATFSSQLTPTN